MKNKFKNFLSAACAFTVAFGGAALSFAGCAQAEPDLSVYYSFDEVSGASVKNVANGKNYKIDYVFNAENQDNIFKPASDPVLKTGVRGNALYMDGFSVKIENGDFTMPKKEITLSAWVAPRVFENLDDYGGEAAGIKRLTTVLGQSSLEIGEGFSFGYGADGLWGVEFAASNEAGVDVVYGFYDPVNYLPLYEWSHIAASIDLNEGYICLSLNGKVAYQGILEEIALSTFVGSKEAHLFTGYTEGYKDQDGVTTQMPSGILDEVKIYEKSLTPAELKGLYEEFASGGHPVCGWENVALDSSQFEGDRYRPQFHAMPPAVWMNEPHAPFYYNGKYHVFYQHNPAGPRFTSSMMRWGHLVSEDLVHWQHVKDAVAPSGVCAGGVWTGGAVIGPDGAPWLLLTAGSAAGKGFYDYNDWTNGSGQNIAYAHPADITDPNLTDWIVEEKVALAQGSDNAYGFEGEVNQFRDSNCFKLGDTYYLTVSSSATGGGGAIPVYTSQNMRNWEYRGYMYENPASELGVHWECVNLLPVKNANGVEKYVLMLIPQLPGEGVKIIDTFYWIGEFDPLTCRFIPDDEYKDTLHKFDYGIGYFNGQAGFYDQNKDRTVLFGIVQGTDSPSTLNSGWAHSFAFPVTLSLDEDGKTLLREPVEEISNLYGDRLFNLENGADADTLNGRIKDIRGDTLKIDAEFTVNGTGDYEAGIAVRYNPFAPDREQTRIVFGRDGVYIDRSLSGGGTNRTQTTDKWISPDGKFKVTILLDRSSLEVYVNGKISFTVRIYPQYGDSDYLNIFAKNASVTFDKFTVYGMKGAFKDEITPAYYGNAGYLKEMAQ